MEQPTLNTARLTLRPFTLDDAKRVQELAGDKRIADTTLLIPHPYPDEAAEEWISSHKDRLENLGAFIYAVTLNESSELIGSIELLVNKNFNNAEIGYWIGVPYWNKGYVSEAIAEILQFAFMDLKLNRVMAHHMAHNAASGKVMEKNGMKKEGQFREHIIKNGRYVDAIFYAILRNEYISQNSL